MQKGSRSGAEVRRNNDGVPAEMIYPVISYGVPGGHHVARNRSLAGVPLNRAPCLRGDIAIDFHSNYLRFGEELVSDDKLRIRN